MVSLRAVVKAFDSPDEVRHMTKGRFEIVRIGGMTIGRATYEPGWKWSEHAGPSLGLTRCSVEHLGLVLEGAAVAAMDDGEIVELRAGSLFYIPPVPHDSWVLGDQRYVSLHFMSALASTWHELIRSAAFRYVACRTRLAKALRTIAAQPQQRQQQHLLELAQPLSRHMC